VARQILNLVLVAGCALIVVMVVSGRMRDRHPSYQAAVGIVAGGVGIRRALMFVSGERERRREARERRS
jgi:hypothetical protein